MKTKVAPTVSQTIKVTIEGKTYELSKVEATKLHDGLRLALNLPAPIQWNPPVVIERNPYSPHTIRIGLRIIGGIRTRSAKPMTKPSSLETAASSISAIPADNPNTYVSCILRRP